MNKVANFYVILLFLLSGMCSSCRSMKYVPIKNSTDSIIIEKLVPVVNPADSANIQALLECDENGKVILKELDIAHSRNVMSDFKIDSLGCVIADMKTTPDTVYIHGKEIRISEKVDIPYPVEKKLTKWQQLKVDFGGFAITAVFVFILIVFGFFVYKIKK